MPKSSSTPRANPTTVQIDCFAHSGLLLAVRQALRSLKPKPRITLSEWADQFRHLSREDSAEPGRWETSRAEYQRGIMDAMSDPAIPVVVCKKCSQVGWTAMLGNAIGYYSHQDPASILVIQPTVETSESWSKERLAAMIRDTPALTPLFGDPKSRNGNNTLRMKTFPGGFVAIIGANAPAGLASRPIRVVIGDEVDRYPLSAGTEGDPLSLSSKRQLTFWNRKKLIGSTPTVKGASAIDREYNRSDMRKFYVPCPHCSGKQDLRWEQVKWDKDEAGNHLPETAHYLCEHCGVLWTDAERADAVARGEWIATAPFKGIAGFFINQLYSPWVSAREIVQEFIDAQGNPELLQVWTNTVLGECWEEQGERVDGSSLTSRAEDYSSDSLPDQVHYATAGVDVQGDRLEVEIIGWGAGDENWGARHEVIYGDPAGKAVWDSLADVIFDRYWTETGRLVKVRATCIDTGGHHAAQVYAFCRKYRKTRVYAIKGGAGARPVWPKRASKAKTGDNVFLIGVDTAKDSWYGRLGLGEEGPGYCHFPLDYDEEWFHQLTAETVVTRYKQGRPYRVWVCPPGRRNEALDMRVYALAARQSLDDRLTKPTNITADSEESREQVAEAAAVVAASRKRRRVRSRGIRI